MKIDWPGSYIIGESSEGGVNLVVAPTIRILPYFYGFSCQNTDYGYLHTCTYTDLLTEQTMIVLTADSSYVLDPETDLIEWYRQYLAS